METAENSLTLFQLEKQAKLNELDTGVPLRISQIHHLTAGGHIPKNLDDGLIFDINNLEVSIIL